MNWASFAIEALSKGQTVQIKPRGHSMQGKVNNEDRVTLAPCTPETLKVGDIVLVRVKGNIYLHLIKAIDRSRFLIGNIVVASTAGSAPTRFMALPST